MESPQPSRSSQEPLSREEVDKLKSKQAYNQTLQAEIEEYKKAYLQEFVKEDTEHRDLAKLAEATLFSGAQVAAKQLIFLVEHGEKDTVRLEASKFVIKNTIGKVLDAAGTDKELEALISSLTS